MAQKTRIDAKTQYIIQGTTRNFIAGFLVERRTRRLAAGTIRYYQDELERFCVWLDGQGVVRLDEITADVIRLYLLSLEQTRNAGGIHASYRALRAFLLWYEDEFEPENWRNPIKKVVAPRVNRQAREGVAMETVQELIRACEREVVEQGPRDKMMFVMLLDTGLRAAELLALNVEDLDLVTGAVEVRSGKGGKRRVVFLGSRSRKDLRRYLKSFRGYTPGALFLNENGERLKYYGLVQVLARRSHNAGIKQPGLHDFRRAFAITMLRNGCDLARLGQLMGHTSLEITKRYLHLVDEDLRQAANEFSPADKL